MLYIDFYAVLHILVYLSPSSLVRKYEFCLAYSLGIVAICLSQSVYNSPKIRH